MIQNNVKNEISIILVICLNRERSYYIGTLRKRKAAELVITLLLSLFIYRIYSLHRRHFSRSLADPGQS